MKKTLMLMALLGGLACAAEPAVYTWSAENSTFYTPSNWTLAGASVATLPGLKECALSGSSGWQIMDNDTPYVFRIVDEVTVDAKQTPVEYKASTVELGKNSTLETSWNFKIKRLEVSEGSSVTGADGLEIGTLAVKENETYTLTSAFPLARVSAFEISEGSTLKTEGELTLSRVEVIGAGKIQGGEGLKITSLGTAAGQSGIWSTALPSVENVKLGASSTLTLNHVGDDKVRVYVAMEENANLKLTSGMHLTIDGTGTNGGVWMKKGSSITLGDTASLTNGTLTVTGGELKNLQDGEAHFGAQNGNRHITLKDSTLTVGSGASAVDAYTLNGGLLKVETGTATNVTASLSSTTSLSVSDSTAVVFGEKNQQIGVLTLGSNATVTLGSREEHSYTLTTSGLVVSGAEGKVNADLVVSSGMMDFSAGHALTMGCTVSIGNNVKVILDAAEISAIRNGQEFVIIDSVDGDSIEQAISLGSGIKIYDTHNNWLSDLSLEKADSKTESGTYAVVVTPEPATATLSLLALAGLCARRRRH